MNLIVCDQKCKHQEEGYCTLNHIASLTNSTSGNCGYYQESGTLRKNNIKRKKEEPAAKYR